MITAYIYNLDKAMGCIVGGAVGDALGYPVEFRRSFYEIQQLCGPDGISRFQLNEDGTAHFSDDTQMTLFTASGLMQAGSELNLRGFGDERSWQYHIASPPLGFIPAAFLVMLLDKAMHFEGAVDRFSLEKMVQDCLKEIRDVRVDYDASKGTYAQFTDDLAELERLVKMAIDLTWEGGTDVANIEWLGGGWTGETALAIALYCALRHTDSFEDAVVAAVNHSGDSDSTGAICGNIMGLVHGYEAIPTHFKEHLELLPVLEEVATDLYTGSARTTDPKSWKRKYLDGHRP